MTRTTDYESGDSVDDSEETGSEMEREKETVPQEQSAEPEPVSRAVEVAPSRKKR
jgi:hypothetical protein